MIPVAVFVGCVSLQPSAILIILSVMHTTSNCCFHRGRRLLASGSLATLALGCFAPPAGAPQATSAATVEWAAYAHDAAGTKYSPAAQITRANVRDLVPIWTYRTGDYTVGDAMARDETTPLFVDNVLYASTPFGGVRALDGDTGAELWSFDSELDLSGD
jgi:glucose dehydrogenase